VKHRESRALESFRKSIHVEVGIGQLRVPDNGDKLLTGSIGAAFEIEILRGSMPVPKGIPRGRNFHVGRSAPGSRSDQQGFTSLAKTTVARDE
jgi:hypothetical protein